MKRPYHKYPEQQVELLVNSYTHKDAPGHDINGNIITRDERFLSAFAVAH
jgi:hypothetical protein